MQDSQRAKLQGKKTPGTAAAARWDAYNTAETLGQLRNLNPTHYTQDAIWDAERGLLSIERPVDPPIPPGHATPSDSPRGKGKGK